MAKSIMSSKPAHVPWWKRFLTRKPPAPDGDAIIAEYIQMRFAQYRRGEYQPIGKITEMWTPLGEVDPQKVIGFGTGKGPDLGLFPDGVYDLLDAWAWDGLPDRYEQTGEQCPECLVPCNECWPGDGSRVMGIDDCGPDGSKLFGKCVGMVSVGPSSVVCLYPGERLCIYGSQMAACGGTGVIKDQDNAPCPSCGGTGKVKCRRCGGSAMMSSGRIPDNSLDEVRLPTKLCPACGGTQHVRRVIKQNVGQYLAPQSFEPPITSLEASYDFYQQPDWPFLKKTLYLGPIKGMMLSGVKNHRTQIWIGCPDMEGNYPHLVSQNCFHRNSRVAILGGVLRPK